MYSITFPTPPKPKEQQKSILNYSCLMFVPEKINHNSLTINASTYNIIQWILSVYDILMLYQQKHYLIDFHFIRLGWGASSVRIKDMQQLSASTPRNLLSNKRSVSAPVLLLYAQLFTRMISFTPRSIALSISLFGCSWCVSTVLQSWLYLFPMIASDEYMLKKDSLIPMQHLEGRPHLSSYLTH